MTFKNWIKNIYKNDELEFIHELFNKKNILRIGGFFGSSNALFLAKLFDISDKSIIYVCKDDREAKDITEDIKVFDVIKSYYFPSIETTPYHFAVIDESIRSQRLEILTQILRKEKCIVILSLETLLFNITPKSIIEPYFINIKLNDKIDLDDLAKKLINSGYYRVSKVSMFGEFSIRGDIIDIFYSIYKSPVRISLFDNIIESIKSFDINDQQSKDKVQEIVIPPNKEYVYGDNEIKRSKDVLYNLEGNKDEKDNIFEKINTYQSFDGEQYYLNLFYKKESLLEYFEDALVILSDTKILKKREESLYKEFFDIFHSTAFRRIPKFKPEEILFKMDDIYSKGFNVIECNFIEDEKNQFDYKFNFKGIPVYLGNLELFKKDVKKYLDEKYTVILFANTDIQSERLKSIFEDLKPSLNRFDLKINNFSILPLTLSGGFISENKKMFFLNDYEIFGKKQKISKHFYTKRTEIIDSFLDLKPGDFVVHINHGIGKFLGIERIKSLGLEKDYISIQYADNDKIFIPVEQLNFIQKYISEGFANPKLDKIGSKGWSKTKERVRESIEKLAKELIKLYSVRLNQKGFAFSADTNWQKEFEAKFPYEETDDQLLTIEEVKRDMESTKPMDRLICGDVGFGKTEVALRAAFKAVMSGKQVIVLVPTTILAEQHYETFCDRFKSYPVNIEMLSRFRSNSEQKKIINNLSKGSIDIIIGTHRLLSKDIIYKNPGLYIIDEEHRFGVKHKEKLKQLRKTIDSLSLTATPIPRTLHMSLSQIRDISIINTPPLNRQSVEIYVTGFNEDIFLEAVLRELERGGQIFFLYNRIKTIYNMKSFLNKILPRARIAVAHGRLNEEDLEDVIHGFLKHEYDILLTTTIIESGIDMPRVNTIFIDRADKFGLAQLYQLKGRVGRSEKKAYAYLFYDPDTTLTEDAMKRLRVISEYTELGSGFKIAMKDLEIRGAGNLFGSEQHGDILAVGFQLYCKLLSEAVNELAPEEAKELKGEKGEVSLELKYNGYIPDSYISDHKQKIEFYKKIAGVINKEEIEDIQESLIDRFGKIPDEMMPLFDLAEIRILCKELNISDMLEQKDILEIKFNEYSKIKINELMRLINSNGSQVFLKPKASNSVFIKLKDFDSLKDKGLYIKKFLQEIT
jgi:transcription-repair coupling factor (superfamily II helicase)